MVNEQGLTPRQQLHVAQLVNNSMRSVLAQQQSCQIDKQYETFGWQRYLGYNDYDLMYRRTGMGKRVVNANVDFTWKSMPYVIDSKASYTPDPLQKRKQAANRIITHKELKLKIQEEQELGAKYTEFEQAFYDFSKKYKLHNALRQLDRLACIGRFSIMVIGTNTGYPELDRLDAPLPISPYGNPDGIAYLMPFSEAQIQVSDWEREPTSPRYGMPTFYQVKNSTESTGVSFSHKIHWTRAIHVADECVDNDVYGTPKLEPIYNHLFDLQKLTGSSVEMFWLGAYQGLVFDLRDDYEMSSADEKRISDQIDNYVNHLQRFMKTQGVDVHSLSTTAADPRGNYETLVKQIAAGSNIPERILEGAENGQYAGSSDSDIFVTYITSRQTTYASTVLRDLIDRLVDHGYLPNANNNEYYLEWPPIVSEPRSQQMANARAMADAARISSPIGRAQDIVTVEELRASMGLDEEKPETQYEYDTDALSKLLNDMPSQDLQGNPVGRRDAPSSGVGEPAKPQVSPDYDPSKGH